jgi:bifunctional ADP-heptose synthase (sugar kinase/adenylyltransferase)
VKLLVLGDLIRDVYVFGRVERMCPEAPVPVLIPEDERESVGGAGLVLGQLKALGCDVDFNYGSKSRKRRFFAGSHLVLRVDNDSYDVAPLVFSDWMKKYDAYVVADYGKGAITPQLAEQIVETGKPCFIDSKTEFRWFWSHTGNVTIFPNEHEYEMAERTFIAGSLEQPYQVVRKLGAKGCQMGDLKLPATVSEVVDVTGAGDIFMAGFVYAWSLQLPATDSLQFANAIAGESCRHVGTHVVSRAFAQSVLDRLRASRESQPPTPESSPDSTPTEPEQSTPPNHYIWTDATLGGTLPEYFPGGVKVTLGVSHSPQLAQIRPESPSDPNLPIDVLTQVDQGNSDESGTKSPTTQQSQSPISSEHQRERKLARDQGWHPKRS